ncbi:PucR family transcriptional regulator ligand-binding domain-containing protein [Gordonia sp. NPDC003429]
MSIAESVPESPPHHATGATLQRIVDEFLVGADPHVLTAHDRLDVVVNWVHSSEIFEIGPLLAGGELLLTTGLGLAGLDAGTRRHYVRDLAERGVAGLAFEVGRTFDAVPDEMVREGSSCRLPIIELRRVLPFIEVCRQANTAIVSGELSDLRARGALDAELHRDLGASNGVALMLEHVSDAARCPIVLVGGGGALLAAHGVDDDRSAWRMVDTASASAPVTVRGREIARVIAGRAPDSVRTELVAALLDCACGPIGTALSRSGTSRSAVGERLIEELLAARPIRRADLYSRLGVSGVSVSASSHLIPISADSPDPRMAEVLLADALAPDAASGIGGTVRATVDATVQAVVVVAGGEASDDAVERVARALTRRATTNGRVTVVVGDVVRPAGLGPGAAVARAVGHSLRTCSDRLGIAVDLVRDGASTARVFTARSLVAEAAMRHAGSATRAELAALIAPLIAHDAVASTRLAPTLEVHLRNGCSATRSAEVLHVGRQSLYQRLDRIRGLLGFDPTEPDMYAPMLLAFSASRADGAVRESGAKDH